MNRNDILDTSKKIINGERQGTYGNAENNFAVIAGFWSVYLDKPILPADVANMMILMKVARNSSGVYKEDNWIDICGYAALGGEIQGNYYNEPCEPKKDFMNPPKKEFSKDNIVIMSDVRLSVDDVAFTSREIASDVLIAIYSIMDKRRGYICTHSFYKIIDYLFNTRLGNCYSKTEDEKVIPRGVKSICYDGRPLYGIKFDNVEEDNE